MKVAGRLISEN